MEFTFQSLPFLFPESQRPVLLAWREAAVQREKRQEERRREQLLQLRQEVALRLLQLQTQQLKQTNKSNHMQQSNEPKQQPTHLQQLDISNDTNRRKEEVVPKPMSQFNSRTLLQSEEPLPRQSEVYSRPLPKSEVVYPRPLPQSKEPLPPSEEYSRPLPQSEVYSRPPPRSEVYSRPLPQSEVCSRPLPRSEVYSRVTAVARGFLTRRLLESSKTSGLIATIRDGGEVLAGLTEPLSQQDTQLRDRVHTQMQLARLKLFEIIHLPAGDRMTHISNDRTRRTQRREREMVVMATGGRGRLSTATQRAMQRRQESFLPSPASLRCTRTKPVTKPVEKERKYSPLPPSTRTKQVSKPVEKESKSAVSPGLTRTKPVTKPVFGVGGASKQQSPVIARKSAKSCPTGQSIRTTLQKPRTTTARQSVTRAARPKTTAQTTRQVPRNTGAPLSGQAVAESGQTQSGQARSGQRKLATYPKRAPITPASRTKKK